MRNRWKALLLLLLVLACAGLVITISAQRHEQETLLPAHYRVYVQDELVDWYAKDSEGMLMLPFVALAESLGIPADWQSDAVAHLSFDNRTWVFDLADGSLKQLGSNSDVLIPPPGSVGGKRTEAVERDAYIDIGSHQWFVREYMGACIDEIDEVQRVVRITHIQKDD